MKQFLPDPYVNPIDTRRYPDLAALDLKLRRMSAGLPVATQSQEDRQFELDAAAWLKQKQGRKESSRILSDLQQKGRGPQTRQAPDIRARIAFADRVLPNKMVPYHLRHDRLQQKDYEQEQRQREMKWLESR